MQSAGTLTTLISSITEFVTAAVGWVTSWAGEITSQPILLIGIVMACAGFGVGIIRRLMRL